MPTDASAIAAFQVEMARETEEIELDIMTVMAGVSAVFDDPAKGNYYVAQSDQKIVASLLITFEWSDWRNGTVWWIQSVYVSPEFRNQGVFRLLYEYVKDLVNGNEDLKGIRLYVDKSNGTAQKVYGHLGMDSQHYQLYEWLKE